MINNTANDMQTFLFGEAEATVAPRSLADRFGENPFSVLRAYTGDWLAVDRMYKRYGIASDEGRGRNLTYNMNETDYFDGINHDTSIFSPRLAALMYDWFCPVGGAILDPFCGGSVRGIVAGINGHDYTGIDIREEQVLANARQAGMMQRRLRKMPHYVCGDSRVVLDAITENFDMVFSCPPYGDLEKYSDLQGDISNMDYDEFRVAYSAIIRKACARLKNGCFAVFVVGEIRDKCGNLRGFVPDTIHAFQDAGLNYYDEIIMQNAIGTARLRTGQFNKSRKIVKTHQTVLVFVKGKPDMGREWLKF